MFIIPFFLPHQGCPFRCLYCDQHTLSGRGGEALTGAEVIRGIEAGLKSPRRRPGDRVEAAFYGGTFTALPRARQEELLTALSSFIKTGQIQGIRLSTRPDALSRLEIEFLKERGVTTVEIGAQSMDDRVLAASRRGHLAEDTTQAADRVREAGLKLGLQLMPGLPNEDGASLRMTLRKVLAMQPDDVRIYPACVLKGTPLAGLYESGAYRPLSTARAVVLAAFMYKKLTGAGIKVIRVGLQDNSGLSTEMLAGPHHPAFGHMVRAEIYYQALRKAMTRPSSSRGEPVLTVAPRDLSQARGHANHNLSRLAARFGLPDLTIKPDPNLLTGWFQWRGKTFSAVN